ncbi:MAG: hypothetical protein IJE49_05570 [Agathobacter sp.]|nr:hypothetical protein [Agathobacter sp.]
MQKFYFFRDLANYNELVQKTILATERNSKNKRNISIRKTFELDDERFDEISSNFLKYDKLFWDNRDCMKIKNGIWECIVLKTKTRKIAIMADGYQYARFVALMENDLKKEN